MHNDELAGAGPESELDVEGFDAEGYVKGILVKEGLEGLLRIERVLVNEIKALDGERKALVYDNYSKLITATDTIRKVSHIPLIFVLARDMTKFFVLLRAGPDNLFFGFQMRINMDPLTPTNSTLSPAISHIAEIAASLSSFLPVRAGLDAQGQWLDVEGKSARMKKQRQQETARWVLAAPRRLRTLMREGRQKEAVGDWLEVMRLLGKWAEVDGVESIRSECKEIMGEQFKGETENSPELNSLST